MKADSSGGPNKLSETEGVELNLVDEAEGEIRVKFLLFLCRLNPTEYMMMEARPNFEERKFILKMLLEA